MTATYSPPISVGLGLGFGVLVVDCPKDVVVGKEEELGETDTVDVDKDTCIEVEEQNFDRQLE